MVLEGLWRDPVTVGVIASMGRSLKTSAASFVEDLLERFAISE
jgi:hypothetical protein